MNTIWAFGDSFTFCEGCRSDGFLPEYYYNYKKEGDDNWPNHLSKLLNLEVKNFGKCGASNDYIIDSIIDNWDFIKEGDYVVIGITWYDRFDIPINDKLMHVGVNSGIDKLFSLDEEEKLKTIINFQYHFANHELYKKRHLKRFDFLSKLLKEKNINIFVWNVKTLWRRFEEITKATNNQIPDAHWSFKGNKDFADMIYKKITNSQLI